MTNDFIIVPKVSSRPDKIVVFNQIIRGNRSSSKNDKVKFDINSKEGQAFPEFSSNPLTKKFHNFKLSPNAQRKIKEKTKWLYFMAKSRYIKTYSKKEIVNFKLNFVTLTLPSKQMHPTSQITSECFNQFLTEIRQRTGMVNYIWKLEFQNNGNVHYHLVTDVYLDFFFVRKIWNRILSKLGYVQAYQESMNSLSLLDYVSKYGSNQKKEFSVLAKRYAKGKSENWENPPSVDTRSCNNKNSIGYYIAKYFSKNEMNKVSCNELDNEDNSFSLRLWYCSRSLSKLDACTEFCEAIDFNPAHLVEGLEGVKKVIYQYCTVFYFNLKKFSNYAKSIFIPYLYNWALSLGYRPALSKLDEKGFG